MAKKQPTRESPSRQLERLLDETLSSWQRGAEIRKLGETEYCNAVLDALDGIATGIKMRLEEISEEPQED